VAARAWLTDVTTTPLTSRYWHVTGTGRAKSVARLARQLAESFSHRRACGWTWSKISIKLRQSRREYPQLDHRSTATSTLQHLREVYVERAPECQGLADPWTKWSGSLSGPGKPVQARQSAQHWEAKASSPWISARLAHIRLWLTPTSMGRFHVSDIARATHRSSMPGHNTSQSAPPYPSE